MAEGYEALTREEVQRVKEVLREYLENSQEFIRVKKDSRSYINASVNPKNLLLKLLENVSHGEKRENTEISDINLSRIKNMYITHFVDEDKGVFVKLSSYGNDAWRIEHSPQLNKAMIVIEYIPTPKEKIKRIYLY